MLILISYDTLGLLVRSIDMKNFLCSIGIELSLDI